MSRSRNGGRGGNAWRPALRGFMVLTLIGAVAPAYSASAHIGAPCDLVSDARGDEGLSPPVPDPPGSGPESLDIVSGDVASNARFITVAVRVADLRAPDALSDQHEYDFFFSSGSNTYGFSAQVPPTGRPMFEVYVGPRSVAPNNDQSYAAYSGTGVGPARGVVDIRHNEIRMTIKTKDLKSAGEFRSPLVQLQARTWRDTSTPQAQAGYREDLAVANRQFPDQYQLGRRSCLAVGRY